MFVSCWNGLSEDESEEESKTIGRFRKVEPRSCDDDLFVEPAVGGVGRDDVVTRTNTSG